MEHNKAKKDCKKSLRIFGVETPMASRSSTCAPLQDGMANKLGVRITAEGIETSGQLKFLKDRH